MSKKALRDYVTWSVGAVLIAGALFALLTIVL